MLRLATTLAVGLLACDSGGSTTAVGTCTLRDDVWECPGGQTWASCPKRQSPICDYDAGQTCFDCGLQNTAGETCSCPMPVDGGTRVWRCVGSNTSCHDPRK